MYKVEQDKLEGSKLHIVDVNSVGRARWFHFKDFCWEVDGEIVGTGAIYGILSLFKKIPLHEPVVFCFDSKNNLRKKEYDGYKKSRSSAGLDNYFKQMEILKSILVNSRFSTLWRDGYEADDFIDYVTFKYRDKYDNIFIYSGDYDLAHLVDRNIYLINSVSKRNDISINNYESVLGIPYNTIFLYKATVGDNSDEIKGIKGFGKKSFNKFINDISKIYYTPDIRYKNLEKQIILDYDGFSEEQREQALQSLNVILPKRPAEFLVDDIEYFKVDETLFKWYLERFGMKSILKVLR